jgi:hypothetical protein
MPAQGGIMNRTGVLLVAVAGVAVGGSLSPAAETTRSSAAGAVEKKAAGANGLTAEEERLQRLWHDSYNALRRYYASLDRIDWVAYYKNHGYQVGDGCKGPGCCARINFAPVSVSPKMQWAVPVQSPAPAPAMPKGRAIRPSVDPGRC